MSSPSTIDRLDAWQRRHRWAGFPVGVAYKFFDDQGTYLAALITYYGFLSLFPLLLLLSTTLGFLLHSHPHLQHQVLHSALAQFPVIGSDLKDTGTVPGRGAGLAVGIVGTIYGSLGVAQAAQNAMNIAWSVPRNERPNPIKARVRSLALLGTVGLGVLGTTVLSSLDSTALGAELAGGTRILIWVLSILLNAGLFLLGFRVATARAISVREVLPGAAIAAVGFWLLQLLGATYVNRVVRHSSATNGTFALVLGLIAWIFLEALIVVISVEVNVVHSRRLYPRALLTPFTDNVRLTDADRIAYTYYARAQRNKGFERVGVHFDDHDGPVPAEGDAEPTGEQRQPEAVSPGRPSGREA